MTVYELGNFTHIMQKDRAHKLNLMAIGPLNIWSVLD